MSSIPQCVIIGCGKNACQKRKNKNGTYLYHLFCSKHQKMRTKLKVSKDDGCLNQKTGYLGFPCNTVVLDSCQLTIDHHDGDRFNNDPQNLKTICQSCHSLKTKIFSEHLNRYNKKTTETTFDSLFSII